MQTIYSGEKKYAETKQLIRTAMQERQLVLFIGAGASVNSGMPLWVEAVSQIAKKLNVDIEKLDYLVIPQYYYNARGRKEYTQLMREIFRYNDKLYPNAIHDAIMRFGADTVITTNYDHLIEQAAENNGEFLYVVSQDSDLPYRKAGKELIKMHGDFEHDNFVLKEDDYLHYHKNFKLIENYVKSLIGTKTVLFIGYSLGDPDVKHIFSWVKEVLEEHFQRAYLIATGRTENQNEIEYYKHLGVNIIYAMDFFGEGEIQIQDHSTQLLQTLNYFLKDEEKEKGIIDSVYSNLKPFIDLNYTYEKYISNAFTRLRSKINEKISLSIDKDNYIVSSSWNISEEETAFLKGLENAFDGETKDHKIQCVAEVLKKSNIRGIYRPIVEDGKDNHKFTEIHDRESDPKWIEAITKFDFQTLNDLKEYNFKILSESKPELYLQQAYICSFLEDYLSAYYCLDNAVNYFYRKREYAWYFISLWNKKNIAQIIQFDFRYKLKLSQDIIETIRNDYESINLEKTLETVPDLGNENNLFLRDLKDFKFASDLFYDVVSNSMKVNDQAKNSYIIFTGLPAYEKMRQLVYDYYRYGICNCLMVDRYRENNEIYNLFARSIFTSVSAQDRDISTESVFGNSGNVHADTLTATDIHLILRYIDTSNLRKLFNEFAIKIVKIDESGEEYLKTLVGKINSVFTLNLEQSKDIFWRFVCFVSHTKINEELAIFILQTLSNILQVEYIQNIRDSLIGFVNSMYSQNLYDNAVVCEAANTLISFLVNLVSDSKDYLYYNKEVIRSLIFFCEAGNVLFDDETAIQKILTEDYYSLLALIYRGSTDKVKKKIEAIIEKWKCPNTLDGYLTYADCVLAGIIGPDQTVESKALDYLIDQNEKKKKELENGIQIQYSDNLESHLLNLYLSNMFIDVERLKDIILSGDNEFDKWLVNLEWYDYSRFDLTWLKRCYVSLLKKLADNKTIRDAIVSIYKEKYSSEYIDNKTSEIIIKYFV